VTPPKYARIDFLTIRTVALRNGVAVCNRILPGGRIVGNEYLVRNPKRADRKAGSFKVNLRSGRWSDFATGEREGDLISLVAWRYDYSQSKAAQSLASLLLLKSEVVL
jgi:hypothetical protein